MVLITDGNPTFTKGARRDLLTLLAKWRAGWGWEDNGYGTGVLGPAIYFGTTGTQRIRIQTREDGLSIDQIVLSPGTYLSTSPGATKNDTMILPKS